MSYTGTKQQAIETLRGHDSDTGSTEVQIGVITSRIVHLTEHLQEHRHDHHSRRGLLTLVGKRGSLLRYLRNKNPDRYKEVIRILELRG